MTEAPKLSKNGKLSLLAAAADRMWHGGPILRDRSPLDELTEQELSMHGMHMVMSNLWKKGLLERRTKNGRVQYRITHRGAELADQIEKEMNRG